MWIVLLSIPFASHFTRAADDTANGADEAALKAIVAGFNNGWNTHDAHAMCLSLADDVQWVNWRGEVYNSRKEVEDEHAMLLAISTRRHIARMS